MLKQHYGNDMLKAIKTKDGFTALDLVLGVLLLLAIGAAGYFALQHNAHGTTSTSKVAPTPLVTTSAQPSPKSSPAAVTSAQLIATAKIVYAQAVNASEPYITVCGVGANPACPFTAQLSNHLASFSGPVGFGSPLTGGAQNGPFGTVSYVATPSATGGTVVAVLTPTASEASSGSAKITWVLTIVSNAGNLEVSNITIQMEAAGKAPACGPVEIYNDASC